MMNYSVSNCNYAVMNEKEKEEFIEKYKRIFNKIQETSKIIITISGEKIIYSVENPDISIEAAEGARLVDNLKSLWVSPVEIKATDIPDEKNMNKAYAVNMVCEEWPEKIDYDFFYHLCHCNDAEKRIIRIIVKPLPKIESLLYLRKKHINLANKKTSAPKKTYDINNTYSIDLAEALKESAYLRAEVETDTAKLCMIRLEVSTFGNTKEEAGIRMKRCVSDCEDFGISLRRADKKPLRTTYGCMRNKLSKICNENVFGRLIPFSVLGADEESGFEYGFDLSDRPILINRKYRPLRNSLIIGSCGSARNFAMWREVKETLDKTHDDIVIMDMTDYSDNVTWRGKHGTEDGKWRAENITVCGLGLNCKYYINPLDVLGLFDMECHYGDP